MKKINLKGFFLAILCLGVQIQEAQSQTPVGDLIGTNARARDLVNDKLKEFALVREYHDWAFDEEKSTTGDIDCSVGPLKWNPTANPTDFTNFDDFYKEFEGTAYPVLKGVSYRMRGTADYDEGLETKPYCQGYSKVNPTEGYRDGNLEAIDVEYQSQYHLEAPVNGVALWMDPIPGAVNQNSMINIRASGFQNVSSFSIRLGWGNSWFDESQGFNEIWNSAFTNSPTINYTAPFFTIDWANTGNNLSFDDGEILLSFDLKLINSTSTSFLIEFRTDDTYVDINGVAIDPTLISTTDRTVITHSTSEVNYFITSTSNPFDDCAEYCFQLYSTGFQALVSSGVNIVWDPAAYIYDEPNGSSVALNQSLPNITDISVDLSQTAAGIIKINVQSPGIDWNELKQVATICLDPTCIGDPSILINGHGSITSQFEPDTWREHALWLSAFAGHFGANSSTNNDFKTLVYPNLVHSTETSYGIGGIQYLENNNEPDKSWYDDLSSAEYNAGLSSWFFSPEQFALMSSVDYDGHNSSVKAAPGSSINIGVKNVNPNVNMVMAGLSGLKVGYMQQMVDWFENNRSGSKIIPYEVINVHHYPTNKSAETDILTFNDQVQIDVEGHAVPPEEDGTKDKLVLFLSAVGGMHSEMADMEFWLTEFGYDSHPASWNAALPDMEIAAAGNANARSIDYETASAEVKGALESVTAKAQADWLVRYYLAISAAEGSANVNGIETFFYFNRATAFDIIDGTDGYTDGLFQTPGLLNTDKSPKKSWFWVMTLKNVLGEYNYDSEKNNIVSCPSADDSQVYLYKANGKSDIYTVWDTDSDGKDNVCDLNFGMIPEVLDLQNTIVVTFQDADENGKRQTLQEYLASTPESDGLSGDILTNFRIKETPIFIIPGGVADFPADPILACIDITSLSSDCSGPILKWVTPTVEFDYYNIYYIEAEGNNFVAPPFDLANRSIKLAFENLPGSFTQALLPVFLEECTPYFFYVVGYKDGVMSEICGERRTTRTGCSCYLGGLSTYSVPAYVADIFNPNTIPNKCALPTGTTAASSAVTPSYFNNDDPIIWDGNDPFSNPLPALELDFLMNSTDEKNIDLTQITFMDGYGTGIFKAEAYLHNDPNIYLLFEYTCNLTGHWVTMSNFDLDVSNVEKIIFSSVGNPKINKIFVCGKIKPAGTMLLPPEYPTGEILIIDTKWKSGPKAELTWNVEYNQSGVPEAGRLSKYHILYSDVEDVEGNLVDPSSIEVEDDPSVNQFIYTVDDNSMSSSLTKFRLRACICSVPHNLPESRAIEPLPTNNLNVYPNPTSDWVTFEFLGKGEIISLEIHNTNGRVFNSELLENRKKWSIDMSPFANGVYFVEIITSTGKSIAQKFILNSK